MKYKSIKIIFIISCLITIIYLIKNNYNKKEITKSDRVTEKIEKVTTKVNNNEAKLTIVGDFLFEQPYYNAINNGEDKDKYFSLVKDYFLKDDLSIGNMEVVIGNDSLETSGTGYEFCAPEYIGKQIVNIGMNVMSTANNHSYDRGFDGVVSTIDFFENNSDILTVGTNKTKEIKNKIININNIKFGFLSYTLGTNKKIDDEHLFSVNIYRDIKTNTLSNESKEKIKQDVNLLKKESDVSIIMIHWGTEFTFEPTEEQKELAEYLSSLKVDIIIGSHSHSIQPIEWIKSDDHKTLVYYSMGNFVSADEDISRAGETFDNAYQFGLLSTLSVIKQDNKIEISNVKTEPIINYYDTNFRNFLLIPFNKYTDKEETSHYRYNNNFNKQFIQNTYNKVINEEFR